MTFDPSVATLSINTLWYIHARVKCGIGLVIYTIALISVLRFIHIDGRLRGGYQATGCITLCVKGAGKESMGRGLGVGWKYKDDIQAKSLG